MTQNIDYILTFFSPKESKLIKHSHQSWEKKVNVEQLGNIFRS